MIYHKSEEKKETTDNAKEDKASMNYIDKTVKPHEKFEIYFAFSNAESETEVLVPATDFSKKHIKKK